jgi:hypothetical protein
MDQPLPDRSVALPTTHTAVEPLDTSFGVEFEFILVEHFPDWDEWINKKLEENVLFGLSRIGNVLRNTLFKRGSCSEHFHMPVGVQDANTSWKSDHSQWNVVADETMSLSPRQKTNLGEGHFDTTAFEVTSRKLFTDRGIPVTIPAGSTTTTHQHTIAPEEEMKTVLDSLHRAFMSPAAAATDGRIKQWLVTNRTCGLHIHVGNDERGFPLQTVKNAMSLHTAFERVIDSMQSKPRIGGTALALAALDALDHEQVDGVRRDDEFRSMPIPLTPDDVPNVPLTEFHIARAWCQRRNTGHPAPPASTPATPVAPTFPSSHTASNARLAQAVFGLHTAAFLEVIQATPNINALAQSFPLPENNVSLLYLIERARAQAPPKTIEFRQHGPVTTAAETLPWINFVSSLVRYAHENSAEKVLEVCTRAAEDPTVTLEDFITLLPMNEDHMFYYLDRVDDPALGSEPFSDHAAARAEVEAAFGDDGGPLRKVVLELIDEREAEYDHTAVRNTVRDKFNAGGYGQFRREFINVYSPDLKEEIKVKLTIGWETPLTEVRA